MLINTLFLMLTLHYNLPKTTVSYWVHQTEHLLDCFEQKNRFSLYPGVKDRKLKINYINLLSLGIVVVTIASSSNKFRQLNSDKKDLSNDTLLKRTYRYNKRYYL